LPAHICAPLLVHPAKIIESEVAGEPIAFLTLDPGQQRINARAVAALLGQSEADSAALDDLLGRFPEPPLSATAVFELADLLAHSLPHLDVSALRSFPDLQPESSVREAAAHKGLRCLPACAVALVPNPPEVRGVLHELTRIAEGSRFSAPLRCLLGDPVKAHPGPRPRHDRVPAVLSETQRKILASAAVEPLTLLAAPPGTGKTYTIAALALDAAARGETVLLSTRTDEALDVLADKLSEMLGDPAPIVRGGRKQHLRQLKEKLEGMLHATVPDPSE